ncbi:DUF4224 domain-containing protein [uncultured Massilia sp.]|uniref:DUF4224 domain-containing protein n=1 Tax=uncultured Massilia sp. TaxID=169973 RepID=UPI00258286B2|nr:DUF4224 domain-containing protein [uncultured Massilia sp.]
MDELTLSSQEIYAITHYKLPKKQLAALRDMGIPAQLRKIDNTVCVLRAHVKNPAVTSPSAPAAPRRKSARQ